MTKTTYEWSFQLPHNKLEKDNSKREYMTL